VIGKHLLRGFVVRWLGTRYDFNVEKALHRKHRYIPSVLLVRDVDELNLAYLRQKLSQLPFLWAEAGGRNYYAEFAFPVDYITESLQYVAEAASKVKNRVRMFAIDQTNAISFTVAPQLFSEKTRTWVFNQEELTQRFEDLLQQIRRESG
jgi:hypothetical protein